MKLHTTIHRILIPAFVIFAVMSLAGWNSAQSQDYFLANTDTKGGEPVSARPEYMSRVQINVLDLEGAEVTDLNAGDFTIYENDVKQTLDYLKRNTGSEKRSNQPMYEAGYYPLDTNFNGELRKIRIEAHSPNHGRLQVSFSPRAYYAKPELRK